MKYRYATALAVVLAAGTYAASAQAAMVSLIDSSTNGGGNQAHLFASGYGANLSIGASWSGLGPDIDPLVVPPPGDVDSVYLSPFSSTALEDTRSYFSSGGVSSPDGDGADSPVTLTLASSVASINLLWGSIDSYNTLTLNYGGGGSDSFTGADIVSLLSLPGSPVNYNEVALMNFTDFGAGGLTSLTFASESNATPQDIAAFEFAFAPVPLPASVFLLLAGIGSLGGLGLLSRRHRGAAA